MSNNVNHNEKNTASSIEDTDYHEKTELTELILEGNKLLIKFGLEPVCFNNL